MKRLYLCVPAAPLDSRSMKPVPGFRPTIVAAGSSCEQPVSNTIRHATNGIAIREMCRITRLRCLVSGPLGVGAAATDSSVSIHNFDNPILELTRVVSIDVVYQY